MQNRKISINYHHFLNGNQYATPYLTASVLRTMRACEKDLGRCGEEMLRKQSDKRQHSWIVDGTRGSEETLNFLVCKEDGKISIVSGLQFSILLI